MDNILYTNPKSNYSSWNSWEDFVWEDFRLLQPLWDLRLGYEHWVTSPIFPVLSSIFFYFLAVMPWTICDLWGKDWKWVQRYKIQVQKDVTWPSIRQAIVLTLWNHLLYLLPVSIAQLVWAPNTPLISVAPTLWEVTWQCLAALAVFDLEYYIWHFTHHKVRFLYKHIHGVHHQYSSPHSWVTQYLHPWELISVGIFTTTSPWFFTAHPFTHLAFQQFAILVSVDAHIGYDIPLLPHRWMPFWGGSIKHDMHHQRPYTNFQPFYNHFDRLFGTECPGQLAGGYKPTRLLQWERRHREEKEAKKAAEGRRKAIEEETKKGQ